MCGLCSDDPKDREAERAEIRRKADLLRKVATHYEALLTTRQPHHGLDTIASLARGVIRFLVQDWVR